MTAPTAEPPAPAAPAESHPASGPADLESQATAFQEHFDLLKREVQKMIVGQEAILDHVLTAMIAGGHVLLEGVPGLGKTMLVRSLASALHLHFQRIQFTPDLMPADLVGTNILVDDGTGHSHFQFAPGPIFCNLLLADEINRATPKTQSALLEAMQEGTVTVAGETRALERPFFVLATQNPLEMEGTYTLPEAQLDRFFFKLHVPYPSESEFQAILDRTTERFSPGIEAVFDGRGISALSDLARSVPIAPPVKERAVRLIMATHPETTHAGEEVKKYVRYGASPRAGQALILAAKIRALRCGRLHVATEDLVHFAPAVLRHRVMLRFEAQADGVQIDALLGRILESLSKDWK